MTWNPTPWHPNWTCDCGNEVDGYRDKCPDCETIVTEREVEQ